MFFIKEPQGLNLVSTTDLASLYDVLEGLSNTGLGFENQPRFGDGGIISDTLGKPIGNLWDCVVAEIKSRAPGNADDVRLRNVILSRWELYHVNFEKAAAHLSCFTDSSSATAGANQCQNFKI
jgi:hypothetical protein